MKTVQLGNSDLHVSALCLGCMDFGTKTSPDASFAILDTYYAGGGRFLDTSNNYSFWAENGQGGESERVLGAWLKERGCRNDMVIATKLGAQIRPVGSDTGKFEGLSPTAIKRAIGESLERLEIDKIDLLYAHIEDDHVPLEDTLSAFNDAVVAGHVAKIGASNHTSWRLERADWISKINNWPKFEVIQNRLSYLMPRRMTDLGVQRLANSELLDYLKTRDDLTLVGYSILLEGTYDGGQIPPGYKSSENKKRLDLVKELAKKLDVSANQLALAWAMHCSPKSAPLIASSKPERLKELMQTTELSLDADTMHRMNTT